MLPKNFEKNPNESGSDTRVYEFGPFRLDARERSLGYEGQNVPVKPRTLEILEVLAANMNQVVTKDELIESVWKDAFVEEANLSVQISALRKIFEQYGDKKVSIETIPKTGYRLRVNGEPERVPDQDTVVPAYAASQPRTIKEFASSRTRAGGNIWAVFFAGLIFGILIAAISIYSLQGRTVGAAGGAKEPQSFKTFECPRDSGSSNLQPGGCVDAVTSFSIDANPNGNWSYGYTPRDESANFILFTRGERNHHFASPEVPVEIWSRNEEWHPLILRNSSPLTIVIQGGFVVPPNMFEIHPGPNGERATLRWTAPGAGHFRAQGSFRGTNMNSLPVCQTSTDALVVHNQTDVRFSENIEGFNNGKQFDLTFKAAAGDTIDFSVGYGSNQNYECDSTGFNVIISTISVENNTH